MNIIKKEIPVTELLAGLAEEASELAQAALKLRRVFDKTNPAPTKEEEAIEHLWEEIADVKLYVSMLDVNPREISRFMSEKQKRWESRLARRENGTA
jgi:NTP pyrophosphatase (non-canonical NTP hydrolase)